MDPSRRYRVVLHHHARAVRVTVTLHPGQPPHVDIRPPERFALFPSLGIDDAYQGGSTPITADALYRYVIDIDITDDENVDPAVTVLEWLADNTADSETHRLEVRNEVVDFLYHGSRLLRAEQVARDTLIAWERVRGMDHPSTLRTATQLALILNELRRYEEAEEIMRDTVARQVRVLGPKDPSTLRARTALANSLRAGVDASGGSEIKITIGGVSRAVRMKLREAESIYRAVLAEVDPTSQRALSIRHQQGAVLHHLRRLRRAERVYRELVADLAHLRGEDDSLTWSARLNLAVVLNDRGKKKQALAAVTDVVAARRRLLGPGHHDTLSAQISLADLYSNQDDDDRAVALLAEVIRGYRSMYGPDHPRVRDLEHTMAALRGLR